MSPFFSFLFLSATGFPTEKMPSDLIAPCFEWSVAGGSDDDDVVPAFETSRANVENEHPNDICRGRHVNSSGGLSTSMELLHALNKPRALYTNYNRCINTGRSIITETEADNKYQVIHAYVELICVQTINTMWLLYRHERCPHWTSCHDE
ncbi:hypothetical protein BDB01DRAFT_848825 [Pilobolus umbonatus]|nr:hypothetical protein BDB01DRAFT_848825 [Pilobolus umbonatus]